MIVGYVNGRGKVIDKIGNFVKHYRQPGTEILRYKDLKVWSYYDWSKCYAGLFIKKDPCDVTFTDEAIVITNEIKPKDQLSGGLLVVVIMEAISAIDLWKLKKQGYKHYCEIPTSEIEHVVSHKNGGYTLYIGPEAGNLNQLGFNVKTDELRKYPRPFLMDPDEWEEHRKKMIAWEKEEKRKLR